MTSECLEHLVYLYRRGPDSAVFSLDFRFLRGGMGLFLHSETDILHGFDKTFLFDLISLERMHNKSGIL